MADAERDRYERLFWSEFQDAREEWRRLSEVLRHALWYNFEVNAANWKSPWRETDEFANLTLHGARSNTYVVSRSGRRYYHSSNPVYYQGPVRDAPPLPPEILQREVQAACEYKDAMLERCDDPSEYAPGGRKYEQLVRESPGALEYERRRRS